MGWGQDILGTWRSLRNEAQLCELGLILQSPSFVGSLTSCLYIFLALALSNSLQKGFLLLSPSTCLDGWALPALQHSLPSTGFYQVPNFPCGIAPTFIHLGSKHLRVFAIV